MPHLFPSAHFCPSPKEVWATAFQDLSQRITGFFVRQASHQRALTYLRGLMSPVERKNGWQMAEELGEVTPYAIQHLLDRAKWDCDGVRDALRAYVCEMLAAPNAVLVIDETGFLIMYNLARLSGKGYQKRAQSIHNASYLPIFSDYK